MPWGPVGRLLLDLMLILVSIRVCFHVGKYLGFGEIAWWKEQEGFKGILRRWTINPMCHETLSPRGATSPVVS